MFVDKLSGILMRVEEDPVTRYRYEIWFDYTRKAINTIGEGAMLAVPNFAGNDRKTHYSVLEVTGILPVHYALGDGVGGYPGFVQEAARNAGQDWVTQDEVSSEDTTKIRCIAVPTNLEIVEQALSRNGSAPDIGEEGNLPMVGHEAHLLDTLTTEHITNRALDLENENLVQIGTLVRDDGVRAYLRVEELIKVHFGIFGFTGSGKSNLLSTLIRKLLAESSNPATGAEEPVKIVIFDLMSEYTGLLLDQLVDHEGGLLVNIGSQSMPESVLTYYEDTSKQNWKRATMDLVNSTVLPKALKKRQSDLYRPTARLLRDKKVIFVRQQQQAIGQVLKQQQSNYLKGSLGNSKTPLRCVCTLRLYTRRKLRSSRSGPLLASPTKTPGVVTRAVRSTAVCVEPATSARRLSSSLTCQILPSIGSKPVRNEQSSIHNSNDLLTESGLGAPQ